MLRLALRALARPVLLAAALLWLPLSLAVVADLDAWWVVPAAVAFLPTVALITLAAALLAIVLRARCVALLALAGLAVLVVPRLDRVRADAQPAARGPQLVVMTANVEYGTADPAALLRIARQERADLLALQEDTPEFHAALAARGLATLMPHGVLQPAARARGISLYSRLPIEPFARRRGDQRTVGGIVSAPGGSRVHVRSAHPPPPFSQSNLPRWKATNRAMLATTRATAEPAVLAGDFNATLDHHPLRHLLGHGFRDAAEQTGDAWRPTWSRRPFERLTIDHILVGSGIAVQRTAVRPLPGSDHDVVVSALTLPG